jgi:2-polyprenyl-6-hydroxyphenyl methylase/3-demethylubiquinone-9 3-methyltransferase
MTVTATYEIERGARFAFGKNWRNFLSTLDEERISQAERSLREMLVDAPVEGRSFLDVGCGSGLFSLSAMRLGAKRVHSLDFDPDSVACAGQLKAQFFPGVDRWTVEVGNALDKDYLNRLGTWDIVYSWGVLHHTGDMWRALDNVGGLVAPGGRLFLSIYNDMGRVSQYWKVVKRIYNAHPLGRAAVSSAYVPYYALRSLAADLIRLRNPVKRYAEYKKERGMSVLHDWFDWLGGYPFEVARADQIFSFFKDRGFALERLSTTSGGGCNQFVFKRQD